MQTFNEVINKYLYEDINILQDYTLDTFLVEAYTQVTKNRRKVKRLSNKTKIIINPNMSDIVKYRKK